MIQDYNILFLLDMGIEKSLHNGFYHTLDNFNLVDASG